MPYVIVKLSRSENDHRSSEERTLPVEFKDREAAEAMCDTLNRNKPTEHQGYVVEERD